MDQTSEPATLPQKSVVQPVRALAPAWHTAVLIVVVLIFSYAGAQSEHALATKQGKIPQYLATIAWEWLLFAYVWWGVRRSGTTVRELIGGRWRTIEDVLMDIVVAIGFWWAAAIVLAATAYAVGMVDPAKVQEARRQLEFLVPRTMAESLVWLGVSATAGFCEEFIFRGYLQRQIGFLSRNIWLGMVISALLFGAAHGYEGPRRMVMIAVFGMMFSLLAHWRRSLRPGMIAHTGHDVASGILSRFIAG